MMLFWLWACSCSPDPAGQRVPPHVESPDTSAYEDTGRSRTGLTAETGGGDSRPNVNVDDAFFRILPSLTGEDVGIGNRKVLIDLDLDGVMEVVVGSKYASWAFSIPPAGGVVTSADARWVFDGLGITDVRRADMNADGHDDLILYTTSLFDEAVRVYFAPYPEGGFVDLVGMNGGGALSLGVDDFDGDGRTDIVHEGSSYGSEWSFFYGPLAAGPPVTPGSRFTYEDGGGSVLLFVTGTDVTGDGVPDILNRGPIRFFYTQGPYPQGQFEEVLEGRLAQNGGISDVPHVVRDYDGQGSQGILTTTQEELACTLYPSRLPYTGDEVQTFVHPDWRDPVEVMYVDDVDGDGIDDVYFTNSYRDELLLVLGPLDRPLAIEEDWALRMWSDHDEAAFGIADSRDVDGDGIPDILFGGVVDGVWVHLVKGI